MASQVLGLKELGGGAGGLTGGSGGFSTGGSGKGVCCAGTGTDAGGTVGADGMPIRSVSHAVRVAIALSAIRQRMMTAVWCTMRSSISHHPIPIYLQGNLKQCSGSCWKQVLRLPCCF
jgi:hypothetical protein